MVVHQSNNNQFFNKNLRLEYYIHIDV